MESKWLEIYRRFSKLAEYTGREKSSSYVMNVIFTPDEGISVELGTYDIADCPRHTYLEPQPTEQEALQQLQEEVTRLEEAIVSYLDLDVRKELLAERFASLTLAQAKVILEKEENPAAKELGAFINNFSCRGDIPVEFSNRYAQR